MQTITERGPNRLNVKWMEGNSFTWWSEEWFLTFSALEFLRDRFTLSFCIFLPPLHFLNPYFFFSSTVSEHSPSGRNTVYMSVCMCESGEGSAARKRLTLCPSCCSVSARGHAVVCWELKRPWVTASFLLWSPWKQESVFPSKLSGALHHIKRRCHESDSSSTGSLTIAELTAYKAVCRSFNGLWFPIWPSWLRYFKSVKWLVLVLCLNS